jgi:HNH endonuclease
MRSRLRSRASIVKRKSAGHASNRRIIKGAPGGRRRAPCSITRETTSRGIKMLLSHSELKRLLHYDPETGIWRRRTSYRANYIAGDRADVRSVAGYRRVRLKGIIYYSHRLAVFYMSGAWPPEVTDHRNGVKDDNRWKNLRCATQSQNLANSRKGKRCKHSSYKGVVKKRKKWWASVTLKGKTYWEGPFRTAFIAHRAYRQKAKELFGEFARAR